MVQERFPLVFESIADLSQGQIQQLLTKAKEYKQLAQAKSLFPYFSSFHHPQDFYPFITVATFFQEHSTRTTLSFEIAAHNLGLRVLRFDPKTSSLQKGEDLEQTFINLSQMGVNLCVYRTPVSHELSAFKNNSPLRIMNAGDGHHQHPSQALLDLFTLLELQPSENAFQCLKNKTLTIVGDCRHSRVCHSLMDLLPMFGMKIILCGPSHFMPSTVPANITTHHDLDECINQSDYLYLLRIQSERHQEKNPQEQFISHYHQQYGVTLSRLQQHHRLKNNKDLPIFHPGPANIGVEVSEDVIKSPFYKGHDQVNHSVFMRMSILHYLITDELEEKNLNALWPRR